MYSRLAIHSHGLGEVRPLALGEEPDVAQVDAEQGDINFADQFSSAQDGAVPAQDHHQFNVRELHLVVQHLHRLGQVAEEPLHVSQFGVLHHRNHPGGVQEGTGLPGSLQ